MKVAIYARVSTDGQELAQQVAACRRFCKFKRFATASVYQDTASGAVFSRPQFDLMVSHLRQGRYDGVVTFRLDRLGRRARDLALLIDELEGRGIHVYSVSESFDTSTAIGRAMREIILIMAQLERENISEATKQRLAALRAAGKRLGRPPISRSKVETVLRLRAEGETIAQIREGTGLSAGSVVNILKGRKQGPK